MAQFTIPDARKIYTKAYGQFRGVDFSADPAVISDSRSPLCKNLIADAGGYPEKRLGWETKWTLPSNGTPVSGKGTAGGKVYGLYSLNTGTQVYCLAHVGVSLYCFKQDFTAHTDSLPIVLTTGMALHKSTSFQYDKKLYILDGTTYRMFDGTTLSNVAGTAETAFVPTTTIEMKPTGGGTSLEGYNLLNPWRMNSFVGNGTSVDFYVDAGYIDADTTVYVALNGGAYSTTGFTVEYTSGKITFTTAPTDGAGVDNVVIKFSASVEGAADVINKCDTAAWFGLGNDSRVFVAGNPDYPNEDHHSGLYDPTYFPDTGYTKMGTDASRIMGYLRQHDNLLIVKNDNEQDATIYMRSAALDDNGNAYFPVTQGVEGIGAVSKNAFGTLRDDPLFLSSSGVYAITLVYGGVDEQRATQHRSYYVDEKLKYESNLDQAVSCVWNGFYILCINSHCYVADARQKTGNSKTETNGYEWFYWDNIDAQAFYVNGDKLFFGTSDGYIRQFKTDVSVSSKYNDDDAAIEAVWSTKSDMDGDFMRLKTMPRQGSGIMVKPYTRSSIEVQIRTDYHYAKSLRTEKMNMFDFNDIDFEDFSFDTNDSPQTIALRSKVRRYKTIQIIARNNKINEGFGIFGIIRRYTAGNFVK